MRSVKAGWRLTLLAAGLVSGAATARAQTAAGDRAFDRTADSAAVTDTSARTSAPRPAPGSGTWPIVLPGLTYAPETQWAAAIGAFKVSRTRAPNADQRPNTYTLRGLYSQRHQLQTSISLDRWRADNAGRFELDAAFSRFPNKFYGVSATLRDTAEQYTPRTASLVGSYIHRVRPGLYVGGRVALEDGRFTSVAPDGRLQQLLTGPTFTGGEQWRTTAVTLIANWDTRDLLFFPSRGSAVWLNVGRALGLPGSTHQFTRVSLDARRYRPLGRGHVLAVQGFGIMTAGDVPVEQLPALGGPTLLRGYFAGRFRDKAAVLVQSEYRTPVWRRLGAVGFASAGTVAPSLGALRAADARVGWGFGLRLALNGERLNLRVDRGFGSGSRGFYISAGEAF